MNNRAKAILVMVLVRPGQDEDRYHWDAVGIGNRRGIESLKSNDSDPFGSRIKVDAILVRDGHMATEKALSLWHI